MPAKVFSMDKGFIAQLNHVSSASMKRNVERIRALEEGAAL